MQLNVKDIWRIMQYIFGSICFIGFAVHAAEYLKSLPGKDKFVDGCNLETINPAGFQMCKKLCKRRTDCCLVNFNVDKLTCSLLSSPCSENDAKIESIEGYVHNFILEDNDRTLTNRINCQFSKCFSSSSGSKICLNYTTPRDCSDMQTVQTGLQQVSTICPQMCPRCPVRCRLYEGSEWTVIQKRFDGSQDFHMNWNDYKHGFGAAGGEFWIGNQALFELTSTARYELMVLITDFQEKQYHARYSTFSVGNEASNFLLTVGGYTGNAGDCLSHHNGMQFSTYDRDNDLASWSCSVAYRGGWWFKDCHLVNLNGQYYAVETAITKSMSWYCIKDSFVSMKSSTMMIRRF